MMLMDNNTIKAINKLTRKRTYYGAVIDKSDPKSLPFITRNKPRELHKRFKTGGRQNQASFINIS
jgi:hypothetical protein